MSLDVVLSEEAVTLQDVNVGGLKEDPAIGMMRQDDFHGSISFKRN